MRRRDGFALLTALWLLLLISGLLTYALPPIVGSLRGAENRILLTRGKWAALGCLELIRARASGTRAVTYLDSVALGSQVWCSAESLNSDERVNPNVADSVGLARVLGDERLVASLLDWLDADDVPRAQGAESSWYVLNARPTPRNGPVADPSELTLVRGFESMIPDELDRWFTVRGDGRVSGNRAPGLTLASIGVLAPEHVARIIARRTPTRPMVSAEQLVLLADFDIGIEAYQELSARVSFVEAARTFRLRGLVDAGSRRLEYPLVVELRQVGGTSVVARVEAP